jgi:hypothetical protein
MWASFGGYIVLGQRALWLGELVENWMGPKYRPVERDYRSQSFSACHSAFFLRREVYGDGNISSPEESALHARYDDWQKMSVRTGGYLRHLLPSPHNKGKAWSHEARATILRDVETHEDWTEWMNF